MPDTDTEAVLLSIGKTLRASSIVFVSTSDEKFQSVKEISGHSNGILLICLLLVNYLLLSSDRPVIQCPLIITVRHIPRRCPWVTSLKESTKNVV